MREYKSKHNPDPEWEEIFTVDQWLEAKNVYIFNDDGCGYWMKDGMISDDEVFHSRQEDATHVIWYSK